LKRLKTQNKIRNTQPYCFQPPPPSINYKHKKQPQQQTKKANKQKLTNINQDKQEIF